MTNETYHDRRFGDTYVISIDDIGAFLGALRYVDRIGADPIQYDRLIDIPEPHRSEIRQKLSRAQFKK